MSSLDVGLAAHNVVRRDGQGRVMLELATLMVERGHRVTVYARRLDPSLSGRVTFRRIPRPPVPQLVDDLFMYAFTTLAMRRGAHDVACVMGPCAAPSCAFVLNAQFSQRGWIRSWATRTRPGVYHRLHARVALRLEEAVARRARCVIASTPELGAEVVPDGSVPVVVVPNGVDTDEFRPFDADARRAAREKAGVPQGAFVVGFLGEYGTGRKGLHPLVEAVAFGRHDEHLLVGATGPEAALRARMEALGVSDRVHPLGFAPPADVLACSDVLAVPSLYEPFSLVAFEAAACAVPVVISRVAGASAHLRDASVVIGNPADPMQIRDAIDRVRIQGAKALGARARRCVEEMTWPAVMDRAADVLEGQVTWASV